MKGEVSVTHFLIKKGYDGRGLHGPEEHDDGGQAGVMSRGRGRSEAGAQQSCGAFYRFVRRVDCVSALFSLT